MPVLNERRREVREMKRAIGKRTVETYRSRPAMRREF
jgi:hypothetical protein